MLPFRPPQETIPQTRAEREGLRVTIQRYVAANRDRLVPPLVLDELRTRSEELLALTGIDPKYRDYVGVLLSNEVWREQLAAVPFDRRLLLLPKCMRVEDRCPAPFDEFGLLCKQCGLCSIQDLQEEAERLGYPVLVAEGSALVMALIQTGKIEESRAVAGRCTRFAGGQAGDSDLGVGNNGAGGIGNRSCQFRVFLRLHRNKRQENKQHQTKQRFGKPHVVLQKIAGFA